MSSEDGSAIHGTAHIAVVLLAAAGLLLSAAVLPGGGGGTPQSPASDGLPGSSPGDASLPGGSGTGGDSFVSGLFGRLPSSSSSAGSGFGGAGDGGSFGALEAGPQTGVGSTSDGVSQSLRSQSLTPHFLVQSPEPGYWRARAYATYTGSGWDAGLSGETRSLPASPTADTDGRRTVEQRYTLRKPAQVLPAMWQPTDIDASFADGVTVTDRGALRAPGRLPANTTYTVESSVPMRDEARLRDAGTGYPNRVGFRYRSVPDSVPDRVAERTAEITADADTPYETAVAIEEWLEANRRYSLDASHDGGDVVDQFLFEMDAGYCEYFATSMTVMLRTQGIPARYAVGYSTGQPQGNDTYLVRGMNAHAWVEVYFPDTGWVRFDPTPGRDRLSSESEALQQAAQSGSTGGATGEDTGDSADGGDSAGESETDTQSTDGPDGDDGTNTDSYDHAETGSPGETFDSAGTAYRISLAADPVPGRPVPVRVEREGDPVANAAVTFDGRPVGTTNASGMLRGPVPYASAVTVNATDPAGDADGASRVFDLPTDITIETRGQTDPGESVTVAATIADVPVADANVTLDGNSVGRTDAAGERSVTLPVNETATVAVTRGAASGNRTLRLADVRVNTSGFALPGLSVTVTVTDGGRPVEGATLTVGDATAETGADGRASVGLPVATGATLTAETPAGLTRTVPVHYRFGTAGALVALVLALAAAGAWLWRRADIAGRPFHRQIAVTLRRLPGRAVAALIALAVRGERFARDATVRLGHVRTALRDILRRVSSLRAIGVPSRPTLSLPAVGTVPGRIWAAVAGLVAALTATAARVRPSALDATDATVERETPAADDTPDAADATATVRRAWREFETRVPVADTTTKTPGELARRAVAAGYPRSAVRRLRDAVRAVEYGNRDASEYVDDVTEAERELADADDDPTLTDGGGSR
ncbi:transglutaminase domain-containing protein [Halorientalis litorea]|uniref:transglutaminase domain-containing protein n=1 Tax=Halorientalis litorea TaxID=2931977 RepID=UPI001FF1D6FF|nr:transglutaminaseTgpA domain-containing protein [Halorientalis litorea]